MMKANGHFMDLSWRNLHGFFKSKQKIELIVWFHCFKNMVIIGKVFQEGFFFVIKSFLKNKEEPNIDLLTLDYLKTFFKVHVLLT